MNKIEQLHKSKEIFFNLCNNKIDMENINFIDSVGATPITWAIILGKYDLVKFLLSHNADINIRVFPFVYNIMMNEYILVAAINIFSLLLPATFRHILNIPKIKYIFHILLKNSYITEQGIPIKYIPNICYEITKHDCVNKKMLTQWDTIEKFNKKIRITFWLYPKIASIHNKFMQKFLKDADIAIFIRKEMLNIFENNGVIYRTIHELLPIGTTPIEKFFNKEWIDIIIPELLHNIVVIAICNCND